MIAIWDWGLVFNLGIKYCKSINYICLFKVKKIDFCRTINQKNKLRHSLNENSLILKNQEL